MKLILQTDSKRVWQRPDGILKIEVISFGSGRRFNGTPASGHWKVRGYKRGDQFAPTLYELLHKLIPEQSSPEQPSPEQPSHE